MVRAWSRWEADAICHGRGAAGRTTEAVGIQVRHGRRSGHVESEGGADAGNRGGESCRDERRGAGDRPRLRSKSGWLAAPSVPIEKLPGDGGKGPAPLSGTTHLTTPAERLTVC